MRPTGEMRGGLAFPFPLRKPLSAGFLCRSNFPPELFYKESFQWISLGVFRGAHGRCSMSTQLRILWPYLYPQCMMLHILVLTKAEQLCGNIGKLLKTVKEAEGYQRAFLSSLICSFCSSASLDENRRYWERRACGIDTQRNLSQKLF